MEMGAAVAVATEVVAAAVSRTLPKQEPLPR